MAAARTYPSGQQKRIAKRNRTASESAEHRRRLRKKGLIDKNIEPCKEPEFGHLWTMRRLLDKYLEIELDEHMTLQEQVRNLTAIASAISRVSLQADMERRVLELQARDSKRVQRFQALQSAYELECKRLGMKPTPIAAVPDEVTEGDAADAPTTDPSLTPSQNEQG